MAPKATGPRPAPPVPPADPERRGPASREAVVATAKRPWRRPVLRWLAVNHGWVDCLAEGNTRREIEEYRHSGKLTLMVHRQGADRFCHCCKCRKWH